MIDEIFDRNYQAGRSELHSGIDGLFGQVRAAIAPALSAIHHFEWDAPWQAEAKPKH